MDGGGGRAISSEHPRRAASDGPSGRDHVSGTTRPLTTCQEHPGPRHACRRAVCGTPPQLQARPLLRHERGSDVGNGRRFLLIVPSGHAVAHVRARASGRERERATQRDGLLQLVQLGSPAGYAGRACFARKAGKSASRSRCSWHPRRSLVTDHSLSSARLTGRCRFTPNLDPPWNGRLTSADDIGDTSSHGTSCKAVW